MTFAGWKSGNSRIPKYVHYDGDVVNTTQKAAHAFVDFSVESMVINNLGGEQKQ